MRFQLDNANTLAEFNKYLTDYSYVEGYTLSNEDFSSFDSLSSPPDSKKYQNVSRWYRHIASFSEEERSALGGEANEEAAEETTETTETTQKETKKEEKADEDFELWGDDEDDAAAIEHERVMEEKAQAALKKKAESGKVVIAKSMVTLDIKPYEAETDMAALEEQVRSISMEGLEWKVSQLVPVCYGVRKLQIKAVVIDDLVSVDDLSEKIQEFEDLVQSVDVAAFNKL
jgi:elongation factor 1-beta